MKTHHVITAVSVVLIVFLGVVAVRQNTQLVSEKARIAQLQGKVGSLEQEVAGLQDTADYYFFLKRPGLDPKTVIRPSTLKKLAQMTGDDLRGKREAFEEAMVGTGPGLDRRVPAAQPEQPAEAGNLSPEQGEPIEYSLFHAKAKSTGLPVGKRYRFTADITHDLMLYAQDSHGDKPLAGQAAFDDEAQHERFLQGEDSHRNSDGILTAGTNHTIVASMGYDGRIQIHRIE